MTEPRYLLDTNICIYLFQGASSHLRERILTCLEGDLAISSIVLAELMVGIERHDRDASPMVDNLLRIVTVLPFDETAARIYGALPFKRAKFDRLIAAHALALGLTLVTANTADFASVPRLKIEDWTAA